MRAFLEHLSALFFALAFGALVFGVLARLLGAGRSWLFFLLALQT
ncbi:hypothetical protein AV541_05120 [Thermus parvatiensis]|uniref:Uncharacterized protein n=1 Tax=Thermus parvatiensis TaxID=456163 RepID=H7GGN6_9DEIN|nr:hypothetical protein [Thermus parvatiensis]AMA76256.1 hypothetical protein AV541_05120 [Thermus parvatiensis]EIA39026.1 hypothetical protein RLTM_06893 [Thermus parvatiensis]